MTLIWPCPDCGSDLEPFDGNGLWCGTCQHYEDPAIMAEPDPDDHRDHLIDTRDGAHVT